MKDRNSTARATVRSQLKSARAKPCVWFALCTNKATATRSHPILGQVPICKRCDDKVAAIEKASVRP